MNALEALQSRKSVRGYLDKPVEDDKLEAILKAGTKAPNAGPFHMTVVKNAELRKEIEDTAHEAIKKSDNDFLKQRIAIPGYRLFYGAPVLVVLSAPQEGLGAENTACAVTNMCTAATAMGLGSCYLAGFLMAFKENPDLVKKLEIPEGYVPKCGFIVGYEGPDQIPSSGRKVDESIINYIE